MSQKYDGMSGKYQSKAHWSNVLLPCARRAGSANVSCVSFGTPWNRVVHTRSCMAETTSSVLYNELHAAVPKGKNDRILHDLIQSMNECVVV